MEIIANIIGIAAVIAFAFSFQCKTRRSIILVNITSRILYVLQYLFLFAFEGAALDLVGALATLPASKKDSGYIKKYRIPILILTFLTVLLSGILLYRNFLSVLPIIGVGLEITAVWCSKEKQIRIISLLAQPFWMIYNILHYAYASAIGNIFTTISILIALCRYKNPKY